MKTLKWCVSSRTESEEWLTPAASKEAAIEAARKEWEHLSAYDKKRTTICAVLANVDETGNYAQLPDGSIDSDWWEVAAEYGKKNTWK